MWNKIRWVIGFAFLAFSTFAQSEYRVSIDLNYLENDRIMVEVSPPKVNASTIIYHMPSMVPGTYSVYDFGQYVSDFKAIGNSGKELDVKRLNDNQWEISNAKNLQKVQYWVADTYDSDSSDVFAPAGTSNSEDAFMLNLFGYVGFLDGMNDMPYKLQVKKPSNFYGVTALDAIQRDSTVSIFSARDYFQLHDCPILFSVADTTSITVAGAKVTVGVYSPGKKMTSAYFMKQISPLFQGAADYLGGELPTKKYVVLIYGLTQGEGGDSYGALEHHTSTVVNVPDFNEEFLGDMVRDVTAHEFFHIVTPLNIHSEYIADYDFVNPRMSKHLWFFEGVTEYNSHIMQVQAGIKTPQEFLEEFQQKINASQAFNESIPMTVASKFTLDYFEDEYLNVYQKGALIGMCLDLELRKLSQNKMGLQDLIVQLMKAYGQDKPFDDDSFFDVITALTYPEIREFFARYVEGAETLPYSELFAQAGIFYADEFEKKGVTTGGMQLDYNTFTKRLRLMQFNIENKMMLDLGIASQDEIVEWNGVPVSIQNFSETVEEWRETAQEGDPFSITVYRPKGNGKYKKKRLKAKVVEGTIKEKNVLKIMEDPTPEQVEFFNQWFNLK